MFLRIRQQLRKIALHIYASYAISQNGNTLVKVSEIRWLTSQRRIEEYSLRLHRL